MISFRQIETSDVPQLTELWLSCFEDTRKAAELFFERNKSTMHGYLAERQQQPIAALYLIDCMLCGKQAHYLCGAATLPPFRKQGIMRGLINYALADAKKRGDCYSVLLPANDGLYGYYAKLGYQTNGVVYQITLDCDGALTKEPAGTPDFERLQRACYYDKFLLWNKDYIQFAQAYYACYGVQCAESETAYALYEQNGSFAEVVYAVYYDIKELKALLSAKGITRFTLIGGGEQVLFSHAEKARCGMTRALDGSAVPENTFIGITLS